MSVTGTLVFHQQFNEKAWLGGAHYFNNLRTVTEMYCNGIEVSGMDLNRCPAVYTTIADRLRMAWYNRITHKVPKQVLVKGRENYLKQKANGRRVCIYSTNYEHLTPFPGLPLIFWIPDFQVLHLPQFFTPEDITYRKSGYAKGGDLATLIVLSSEAARKDLVTNYPSLAPKARVMHFVSELAPDVFGSDPSYVCQKYALPNKFFYVPNQYWQHKNHGLIVKALAIAMKRVPDIHVVFSGSQNDSRNPGYAEELRNVITSAGIDGHLSELGIVPKEDVYALMRQSCSLINVSRFEGWSTTVEEAKAIGKPIVLSSIDVHLEQNPPEALYTGTDDVNTLSEHMQAFWDKYGAGPNPEKEIIAREAIKQRLRSFAQCFEDIIEEAFAIKYK